MFRYRIHRQKLIVHPAIWTHTVPDQHLWKLSNRCHFWKQWSRQINYYQKIISRVHVAQMEKQACCGTLRLRWSQKINFRNNLLRRKVSETLLSRFEHRRKASCKYRKNALRKKSRYCWRIYFIFGSKNGSKCVPKFTKTLQTKSTEKVKDAY